MTNKFFRNRYKINTVVQCELGNADYVCAELYRRLLNLYSDNLLYMAALEDTLEEKGICIEQFNKEYKGD
jgi:hypothetical protein